MGRARFDTAPKPREHAMPLPSSSLTRVKEPIEFMRKMESLKSVTRANFVGDGSRLENSAEHSWYTSIAALVFHEWSNDPIDLNKVVRMLLVHDIVEAEAGDTDVFDAAACIGRADLEHKAAMSLFFADGSETLEGFGWLWREFDAQQTPEAKFARAIDMFVPLLMNVVSEGNAWGDYRVDRHTYVTRKQTMAAGSARLWSYALELIDLSVRRGWIDGNAPTDFPTS
jgi:putative hydrolase of HD superfamily